MDLFSYTRSVSLILHIPFGATRNKVKKQQQCGTHTHIKCKCSRLTEISFWILFSSAILLCLFVVLFLSFDSIFCIVCRMSALHFFFMPNVKTSYDTRNGLHCRNGFFLFFCASNDKICNTILRFHVPSDWYDFFSFSSYLLSAVFASSLFHGTSYIHLVCLFIYKYKIHCYQARMHKLSGFLYSVILSYWRLLFCSLFTCLYSFRFPLYFHYSCSDFHIAHSSAM